MKSIVSSFKNFELVMRSIDVHRGWKLTTDKAAAVSPLWTSLIRRNSLLDSHIDK
jgi:hypothetical protein